MSPEELGEALADQAHESWSHWMRYQFSVCEHNADGSLTIPAELVGRWSRQVRTSYAQLSGKEQDSDRAEVLRILPIVERWTNSWIERTAEMVSKKLEEVL